MFFDYDIWLRLVGRVAMPIFLFFAGYNYNYIKQREGANFCFQIKKYKTLIALGLATQATILMYLPIIQTLNILLSIIISLVVIDLVMFFKIPKWLFHVFMFGLVDYTYHIFDYGTLGMAFVFLGSLARNRRSLSYAAYLIFWLGIEWLVSCELLGFADLQKFILILICFLLFYIFYWLDLKKKFPSQIVLVSRYILPIYFWHFNIFVMIAGTYFF